MAPASKKSPRRKAGELATGTATSLVSTAVGAIAGPASGTVARSVMNAAGAALFDFVADRRARRANAFATAFMESGEPDETSAALLRAELERSPDAVKDAVVAAFREMEEALCEEVVPALGLLTRGYARAGRGRDAFFVGTARLLRDIATVEELNALRTLLSFTAEEWPSSGKGAKETIRTLCLTAGATGPTLIWGERPRGIEWQVDFERPMHLLTANQLFVELPRAGEIGEGSDRTWRIEWTTCSNLLSILR